MNATGHPAGPPAWLGRDLVLIVAARTALVLVALPLAIARLSDPAYVQATEIPFFFSMGLQSSAGRIPAVDYWVEYPPIFPWLVTAIFQIASFGGHDDATFGRFATLLMVFNTLAEYVNLVLLYLIVRHAHGRSRALMVSVLYALLLPPVRFALLGMVEPLALTMALAAVLAGITGRQVSSGALTALGFLIKIFPLALAPALLTAAPRGGRRAWLLAAATVLGVILLPLLVTNPDVQLASFRAQTDRPPWGTPWAAITGCCAVGKLPDPSFRDRSAPVMDAQPSALPWPVIHLGFALVYGLVFLARRRPVVPAQTLTFSLFSICMLLLWSKGFSPQFTMWVLPFALAAFPSRLGLLAAVGLTLIVFAEYLPISPDESSTLLLVNVLVFARTAILLLLAWAAARAIIQLRPSQAVPEELRGGTGALHEGAG